MRKNVFAIDNSIIVLTFHAQDLTKGCGRCLQGPGPDPMPVPGPVRGPCWQKGGDFLPTGQQKRNEFGPDQKNTARADLYFVYGYIDKEFRCRRFIRILSEF